MKNCPSCGKEAFEADQFCRNCGAVIPKLISRNVQVGRNLVFFSAIITFGLHIMTILYGLTIASMTSGSEIADYISDLVSILLEIVIFYFIFRGYSWARWLMGILALIGTFVGLVFLQQGNIIDLMMLLLIFGTGSVAVIFLLSPSVREYQRVQRQAHLAKRNSAS